MIISKFCHSFLSGLIRNISAESIDVLFTKEKQPGYFFSVQTSFNKFNYFKKILISEYCLPFYSGVILLSGYSTEISISELQYLDY